MAVIVEPDELQFRIRMMDESTAFPVNLISIDYRSKLSIKYRNKDYIFYYTIPILDIVMQENTHNYDTNFIYKSRIEIKLIFLFKNFL